MSVYDGTLIYMDTCLIAMNSPYITASPTYEWYVSLRWIHRDPKLIAYYEIKYLLDYDK